MINKMKLNKLLVLIMAVSILQSCALTMLRQTDIDSVERNQSRTEIKERLGSPVDFSSSQDVFKYCPDSIGEAALWSVFTAGIIGVMTCGLNDYYMRIDYDQDDQVIGFMTLVDSSRRQRFGQAMQSFGTGMQNNRPEVTNCNSVPNGMGGFRTNCY